MKQTEVRTEYQKAKDLMEIISSIFHEMKNFEVHRLVVRVNDRDYETISVDEIGDLYRVHQVLQRIMIETFGQVRIDRFIKPMERGVTIVNLEV